jgi:alanine dehydrogenase
MIVGVPNEIKNNENTVAATPESVKAFCDSGHRVMIETSAGAGSGIADQEYESAGGRILQSRTELFARADMILKVREPLPPEYRLLKEGQILFAFLLPARDPELTSVLMDKKLVAVAYEETRTDDGSLPLLASMSRIAGKMGVLIGAQYLQQTNGGRGILLGQVPGVPLPNVMILGGGTVGTNAALAAAALGAQVAIMEIREDRLRYLNENLPSNATAIMSTPDAIRERIEEVDLVINATVWPADAKTHLVTRDMLSLMKRGSVIVDVSAEENGAIETCVVKTHTDPTYEVDGVLHYCVQNMPGAVPKTATPALVSAVLTYALEIANKGWRQALRGNSALLRGLCFACGSVTHEETARVQGLKYCPPHAMLESS